MDINKYGMEKKYCIEKNIVSFKSHMPRSDEYHIIVKSIKKKIVQSVQGVSFVYQKITIKLVFYEVCEIFV